MSLAGSAEDRPRGMTPLAILAAAAIVGLAAVIGEVLFVHFNPFSEGSWKYRPQNFVLFSVLGLVPIFLIGGLALAALSRLLGFLSDRRRVLTLLLWPLFVDLCLLLLPRIAAPATLILALGLAVTAMRGWEILRRRVPRAGLVLPALIVAAVIALAALEATTNDYPRRELGAPRAGARNLILITLDTLRAADTSLHGFDRETTPELDRFAERGTVFDRAYAPSSWTLPSHASLFTGLRPEETGAGWVRPLRAGPPTIAEILRDRGYDTAGLVANLEYCTKRSGLARGFDHYEDHRLGLETILMSSALGRAIDSNWSRLRRRPNIVYADRKNAGRLTDDAIAWLDGREGERPFFLFLNYFDYHQPYATPEPFDGHFDHRREKRERPTEAAVAGGELDRLLRSRDRYDGAIRYADRELGRLFRALEDRGLLARSLVVVTSDHGETFFEHRPAGHGNSLYVETLHVPLVVVAPGLVPAGRRLATEVSLRDLGRSCLELLLPGDPVPASFPGARLPLVASDPAAGPGPVRAHLAKGLHLDRRTPNATGDIRTIIDGGLQLIEIDDPSRPDELYDLERDPWAREDLIEDEAYRSRLEALRGALRSASGTAR